MVILVMLIATALAFDFTNGFHDTEMRWRRRSRRCAEAEVGGSARGCSEPGGAFLSVRWPQPITSGTS